MAITVPTLDGPQVQTRALGAPQISRVAPDQSGAAMNLKIAGALGKIAEQETDKADTAAVMEAEAALSQSKLDLMFNPEQGVYSKKGKSALDITNQTLPMFDKQAEQIQQGLTNPRQKEQFQRIMQHQRGQLDGELNRYEFAERNVYYDQVDEANIATSAEGAMRYSDDPAQVAYYQNKGEYVIQQQGIRKGLPPEAIELERQKFNSNVNVGIITKTAASDPLRAQQIYAANYAQMTPDAQMKMTKLLGTSVRQQMAAKIGNSYYTEGTPGNDGLIPIIMDQESGGNTNAVSPKGASGLMQLMPATAKEVAAEMGVTFDEARLTSDPNYNMALGTHYLNKMLGQFSQNKTLAVAAYNAGPGMVEDWLNGTNKTGKNPGNKQLPDPRVDPGAEQAFIAAIPFKETQQYTASIMGKFVTQSGQPASVQYANALKRADSIPDPELKGYVIDNINAKKKQADAEIAGYYDQASQYVTQGGYQTIPAPLLNNLPADEQMKLRRLDAQIQKGESQRTDQDKYREFISMPPEKLALLDLGKDVAPYLSTTDLKSFRTVYEAAKKGDGAPQNIAKAKEDVIDLTMSRAGIITGKSKDALNPKNIEKQDMFRTNLQSRIDSYTARNGKEPDVTEVESLAQQLLLEVKLPGGGVFGSTTTKELWEINPEKLSDVYVDKGNLTIENIPSDERRQIIMEMRNNGEAATVEGIINNYINRISGQGVKVK